VGGTLTSRQPPHNKQHAQVEEMLAEQAASYSLLGGGSAGAITDGSDGAPALPGRYVPGIGGGAALALGGSADAMHAGSCVIEDVAAGISSRRGAGVAVADASRCGAAHGDFDVGGLGAGPGGADAWGPGGSPATSPDKRRGAVGWRGRLDVSEEDDQGYCGGEWAAV